MAKVCHSPNSLMSNLSSSRRSSDVDFSDVFGGPPRRSSTHEGCRNSVDGFVDGTSGGVDLVDVDGDGYWSPFFGLGEKPVFGDEMGGRRRYPSDDFFDDIFRGDQPLSSSQSLSPMSIPRRGDSFSSAPGSRVMSPARPLPPSVEPFANPAKFSLPARLANTDMLASSPVNKSSGSPSSFASRFNQPVLNHDAVPFRPSPLSHQSSGNGKEPTTGSKSGGPDFKVSKSSEVVGDGTQFHFSMYKWANKGVPLVMSLRKRSPSKSHERTKVERCLSVNESKDNKVDIPADTSLRFNRTESQSKQCNGETVYTKASGSPSFDGMKEQVLENPKEVTVSSKKSLAAEVANGSTTSPGNSRKSSLRPLASFLQDKTEVITKKGDKDGLLKERKTEKEKEKATPSLADASISGKVKRSKVRQSSREANDDSQYKDEVAGKVKGFVKIFNHDSSSKPKKDVLGQSQSWRSKGRAAIFAADNVVKSVPTDKHDEERVSNVDWSETLQEAPEVVHGNSSAPEKDQFGVNSSGSVASDTPGPAPANEPGVDGPRASTLNMNPTLGDNIPHKELLQDMTARSEVEHQEETKGYESKVRQWSKGKEGNIRALLSTLQYVLWPNSGWKPVPLVSIIEANAVKRAYQKALLCLHPDKLQQKGAAPHQKFIAEKVFDVLQEAWDQFNSLGHL